MLYVYFHIHIRLSRSDTVPGVTLEAVLGLSATICRESAAVRRSLYRRCYRFKCFKGMYI